MEIDFTEVKPGKFGSQYLLVFVDTFSGWVEAFRTRKDTSQIVVKMLLEQIIAQYGIPEMLGSDTVRLSLFRPYKGWPEVWGLKLRCEHNPQSSGQEERMNRTIKETLSKLAFEAGGDWVTLLPFSMFRVQNSPYMHGLTPFEIMYGALPPIVQWALSMDENNVAPNYLASIQALLKVQ